MAVRRSKTSSVALATLICAAAIGYYMQYGGAAEAPAANAAAEPIRDVAMTSLALGAPRLPDVAPAVEHAAGPVAEPVAAKPADAIDVSMTTGPENAVPSGNAVLARPAPACEIVLEAVEAAGAQVDLTLTAPCQAGDRVTLHHSGLMITKVMPQDGPLAIRVPALSDPAVILAEFADDAGAMAQVSVPALPFYDRVALQWKGETGLQLHALEFGASYFGPGHRWSGAMGDLTEAARGEGGFFVALGDADTPDAYRAEVYSFPAGTARRAGTVALSVEAEVTEANCGREIEAQTLVRRSGATLRSRSLAVTMPGCDGTGDFLVLKNLVEDLTLAQR